MGLGWLFIRSISFIVLFIGGAIAIKLSPDIIPVLQSIRKRLRLRNNRS
jgi:hypothetical protein